MTEHDSDASIASEGPSGTVFPRVELRGIRKSFGTTDALRGVDLHLAPGEVLGLVGDNAAGKSTLYVLVPIANNRSGIDWEGERARYREKVLDLLEELGS